MEIVSFKQKMEPIKSKIILVGETGVGKSSLVHYIIHGKDGTKQSATICAFFHFKKIVTDKKIVLLHIWDTAGQERYRSLISGYYRDANVCLLVCDVENEASFKSLDERVAEVIEVHVPDYFILILNKCDLPNENWRLNKGDIIEYCRIHNYHYFFTSAVTGEGVSELLALLMVLSESKKKETVNTVENPSCCNSVLKISSLSQK